MTSTTSPLITISVSAGTPDWFENMAELTWYPLDGTVDWMPNAGLLSDSALNPLYDCYIGNGRRQICNEWTGGCADQSLGEIYIPAQGGHKGWGGNEVYALALRQPSASVKWCLLTQPTPVGTQSGYGLTFRGDTVDTLNGYYNLDTPPTALAFALPFPDAWGPVAPEWSGYDVRYSSWLDRRPTAIHGWYRLAAFEGKIYLNGSGMSGDARIDDKGLWMFDRFYAGIPPVGDARATPALDHPLQTYDQIGATASGPWTHIGVYWQQPDEFIDGFGGLHSSSLVDRWNRKYWWICENVPSSNPGAIISIDIDGLPVDIDPVTHKPAGLRRYGCSLSSTEGEAPVAAIVPHADDVDSSGAAKPDDELAAGFVRTYIVRISTDISIASAYKVIVVPLFGLTEETNIKPQIARYHTTQSDGSRSVDGSALHGHYLAPGLQYHHASRALVLCNPGRTGTYGTAGDFAGELRALAVPDDPMNAVEADWRWRIVSVDGTNGVPTPSASQQSVFRGTYGKSGIIDDMGNGQSLLYCVTTWDVPTFVCKLPVGGV